MNKAIIVSDLHFEWNNSFFIPKIDGVKFLILAGDIGSFKSHLPFIEDAATKYTVIYILGNHECYGYSIKEVREFWKSVKIDNFYFLDNESVVIDDIKFIGSTLWVNFDNENPHCMMNAPVEIKDFSKIIKDDQSDFITPYDILEEFKVSYEFIKKELYSEDDFKKVLITHYATSSQSVPEKYKHHRQDLKNNSYYYSNLEYLVGNSGAKMAIHGHMHTSSNYMLGDTRVICNPLGYPEAHNTDFGIHVFDL